jgi:hypothetical protein
MTRAALALCLMLAPIAATAADDLKVSQLEVDVRDLRREVQGLSRQIDELQRQITRSDSRERSPLPSIAPGNSSEFWVDASRWQRLRTGMSELEVISALGPPTSMRGNKRERLLLYATEIGSSGFLGGSVRLRDGVVVEVRKPTLQ